MTPLEAKEQRAKAHERHRNDERLCALDFLTWGDTQGEHAKRCVFVEAARKRNAQGHVMNERSARQQACSRDYNPGPQPEDEKLYRGSALGVLWGLNEDEAWQLAGWNITRRREIA